MNNKKIVIAGGAGFIGQALAACFGKENHIVILSRSATDPTLSAHSHNNAYSKERIGTQDGYNITYCPWDGRQVEADWAREIDGCDLVINLAGKSVNCRYTRKNKQEIIDSRVDSTRAIGQAIRGAAVPPKVWINAASATIYRHAEDHPQDEFTGEIQNDFSVQVCKLWEQAFNEQDTPLTRKITLRMAVTLGDGSVMVPYLNLLKFGLGGRQGNGRQMYSWLHIDDLCRAVTWIVDHPDMEGIYNLCSPCPVPNHEFMAALRKAAGIRFGLPAYTWMLKIGAAIIGTEPELVLKSRWVLPTRLQATGFTFRYPLPADALAAIIQKMRK